MGELLPSTQAASLQRALLDYLTTTFALADVDAQQALGYFLEHHADGVFKGPYIRTRLPFAPAAAGWETLLDDLPAGFVPYGHQAAAFTRLSGRTGRPQPTLVTTGTGSGKTEAFLYPILDQVLRSRRDGQSGMTALILYPMNALANDQASRLARLITARPEDGSVNPFAGVTAALYTGEDGPQRTKVTTDGLITSRAVIRSGAPDILLTNYKMLDHLLLRAEDAALWQRSAESLRYVVLDEFHTYDGAQGTDVAMLLRRLGLALKHHWPARGSAADQHPAPDWERPLGQATPVGTSATLGDGQDSTAMVGFASEVFGEQFDADCVITETRIPWEHWAAQAALPPGCVPAALSSTLVHEIVTSLTENSDGDSLTRTLLGSLITDSGAEGSGPRNWADTASPEDLLRCAQALPLVASLVEHTQKAANLEELLTQLLPVDARGVAPGDGAQFVSLLVAALSHLRAVVGRDALSVEVHLWIRELTRIDRVASSAPAYRWGDDGSIAPGSADLRDFTEGTFPAIYCRHCGRSGWGVELATTGSHLNASDRDIRRNHLAKTGRFRALIHAPSEAQRAHDGDSVEGLAWLNTQTRELGNDLPDTADAAYRDGRVLPTLTLLGRDADDNSRDDTCPSCLQRDGIRFLGSAIATLLSVTLTTLFGSADLDPTEKKALVFTDSVQDAAHRAGFVAARSHTFTLRSAIREGLNRAEGAMDLTELTRAMLTNAGDDPFRRYRLLPTSFLRDETMRPFWTLDRQAQVPRAIRGKVQDRLLFDLGVEFGLGSQVGRTLEATGSVATQVDLGTPARIATLAEQVIRGDDTQTLDGHLDELVGSEGEATRIRWVRGVVEHLRTQGAVHHPWLERYLTSDGNRWFLTGGRKAGMPGFPKGRTHPAFPRVGGKRLGDPLLDPVTDPQSWYARWTARALQVSPAHGASLARRLFERLARESLLRSTNTDSGGTVYSLAPERVLVVPTADADLSNRRHLLECAVCHTPVPGTREATDQREGAPCLYVRCPGQLARAGIDPANFYRRLYASSDMRRIVAREHTSLLESKQRLAYEAGFRRGSQDPDAPNTLVATPTLEMGIDIGDLSAVFLASLPRTVASYLQRIGRAGRLTGNSLSLAYVTGRGEFLPRLSEPTSLINGAVRPPAIYLSAEEILQRQYLAHLVDRFARDGVEAHHPRTARAALERTDPGTFLGDLIAEAETNAADHLNTFLACFDLANLGIGSDLREASVAALREWARPGDLPGTSQLAASVLSASGRWRAQRELLEHRQRSIQDALPELQQAAAVPAASEDDKRSVQTAQAALRLTQARLGDLTGEYWIAALEEFGLLPNYTLLGDTATLDVSISWFDPDSSSFEHESTGVTRPVSQALREFAPGATFYAKGLEIAIDAVDLGTEADGIREIAFCPECGYAVDTEESGQSRTTGACPRCGSAGLQDIGQRLSVVELKRSSAAIRRDEALIDDRRDDRQRTPFTLMTAADIDPRHKANSWYVDGSDFGAAYLSRVKIRWLNVGRRATSASLLTIAGDSQPAAQFRVCEACGHLDTSSRANSMDEHRPWCPHRKSAAEHTRTIALSRTLTTQGVLIALPWNVSTGDLFALPSLQAALLRGLRDTFGGSPDHIGVALVRDPQPNGTNNPALLLHDTVPGGTGYLADLADPDNLWALLEQVYRTVRDCSCRQEDRLACHRCLLPYAPPHEVDKVSRQSAERHLRSILGGADEPGPERGWEISEQATRTTANESHLELRFRDAFRKLIEQHGATVQELPGPWGNSLTFTLGSTTWSLKPQIQKGNVRPDFMLEGPAGLPSVAIFTDGFTFHATKAHNRVADDAEKRESLRLGGDRVLAVTSTDLDAAEAGTSKAPEWINSSFLPGLTQAYGFTQGVASATLGGPLAQLSSWIQQGSLEDAARFAAAVPLLLPHSQDLVVPERASLSEIAEALFAHPDDTSSAGTINAWWWRHGALGVLARRRAGADGISSTGALIIDVAVILDERPTTVAEPGFRRDWETWLRVSNLLAFRPSDHITTISVLGGAGSTAPTELAAARRVRTAPDWQPVIQALLDDAAAIALANKLAARNVRVPDTAGEEVGTQNIPLELGWEHPKVAVLIDPSEEDVRDLEADGWRVVAPDADLIAAALEDPQMTINLIMSKPATQLDPSVLKKAYAFLQKITTDDTAPGLHIEPIQQAADPRVRTGRVDQQYRAVLFKLSAGRDTTYVFHGIWNHDEAIAIARTTTLGVNPVNGLPEIRTVAQERIAAGLPADPGSPAAKGAFTAGPDPVGQPAASRSFPENTPEIAFASPQSTQPELRAASASEATPRPVDPTQLIDANRSDLITTLGLPAQLADRLLAARTEADLTAAATGGPEWQQLAVVGLAAGMSVAEVIEDLGLRATDPRADADGIKESAAKRPSSGTAPLSDDDLLASLDHPAAAMEFARIAGADELRRVIEGGDFGAWRIFLHPEQRRFVQQSTNGAFRISGGAGTGKTVVLLHRTDRLARALPKPRVVLTTFTRNLADGMARDLQRLDPDVPLASALGQDGVWVSGIDAIARRVLQGAGAEIAPAVAQVLGIGHAEVSRITWELAWRKAIDAAGTDLPDYLRSPHFFIAEYGHVILPQRIITREAYLRVRRPGRGVRLSRPARAAVWEVVEGYRRASRIAGTIDFDEAAAVAAAHLELEAANGRGRLADHVLVDEGQDLKPTHWQLLRALVEPGSDDLFIAEDSHQRIFGEKVVLSHQGIAIRGRSRRLTLNYRTTAENLRWAVSVLEGGSYTDLEDEGESTAAYRSARRGPEPVVRGFPSLTYELDYTANTVRRWIANTPSGQRDSLAILVRDSRQRELVVTGLAERGVPVRAVDREAPRPGSPAVMTMHRAKGTEFAKVLLFGVAEDSIPIPLRDYITSDDERSDVLLRERSLLYVAASRARDELVVTWSGARSPLTPPG